MRGLLNKRSHRTGKFGRAILRGGAPSGWRRWRHLYRSERGAAGVELAVVLPVITLLVLGAIDFGSAYVEGQRLASAAQAGTQVALYDPVNWDSTDNLRLAALEEYVGHGVEPNAVNTLDVTAAASNYCACVSGAQIACTDLCPTGEEPGQFVDVSVGGSVSMILSYPWLDGNTLDLTRSSIVRVH